MKITPSEIENKTFKKRFRGFDRTETREFLSGLSEQIVEVAGELENLRQQRDELQQSLDGYKSREAAIQETLYAVRNLAEEIKNEARREADLIVREAGLAAERQLQQGREQVAKLEQEISHLRLERDAFEDRVKLAAEEHLRVIESRRQEGEVRDKLRILSRRHVAIPPEAVDEAGHLAAGSGPSLELEAEPSGMDPRESDH